MLLAMLTSPCLLLLRLRICLISLLTRSLPGLAVAFALRGAGCRMYRKHWLTYRL